MIDGIGLQSMLFFGEPFELVSIKTVEPIIGTDPDEPLLILVDALYIPVGKPVFNAKKPGVKDMLLCRCFRRCLPKQEHY